VYAATDFRPRQSREIALCTKASVFDWQYTGAMTLGLVGAEWLNLKVLKYNESSSYRLMGPGLVGLFWGGFLSGGYLSFPTCDPLRTPSVPPEGNVRAAWPMAAAITLVATATAPVIDYALLGDVPWRWTVTERSARVFVAMGAGAVGALVPYVIRPRTWAAKLELERIRVGEFAGGPFVTYQAQF